MVMVIQLLLLVVHLEGLPSSHSMQEVDNIDSGYIVETLRSERSIHEG